MRLTILNDNTAGPKFLATHGFSCYIESDINVLFDVGPDNTFAQNAERAGINLKPDYIVLSHGHWDHVNGLDFAPKAKIVCHPAVETRRFSKIKDIYVGVSDSSLRLIKEDSNVATTKPYFLSESVVFLGEIPRIVDFECKHTNFKTERNEDDFIPDDSAIVVRTSEGIVIISGCAHSGICNTILFAMEVTNTSKVIAVFGGYHLKSIEGATQKTIQFLKDLNISKINPSHCTSLPALSEFYKVFRQPQVLTGNYYSF